jgi:hypothetical protein
MAKMPVFSVFYVYKSLRLLRLANLLHKGPKGDEDRAHNASSKGKSCMEVSDIPWEDCYITSPSVPSRLIVEDDFMCAQWLLKSQPIAGRSPGCFVDITALGHPEHCTLKSLELLGLRPVNYLALKRCPAI